MAIRTFLWRLWILMLAVAANPSAFAEQVIVSFPAQDVPLTCRASNNNIQTVEWSRADLGDECVLVYRDGHFLPDEQHPSFKDRVDLQDRQMKDGDVSVILKNVTINDAGPYVCRVFNGETQSWEYSIINLSVVVPPAQTGGETEDGVKKEDGGPTEDGVKKEDGGPTEDGVKKEDGGPTEDGGKEDQCVGLKVGLTVCGLLLLFAVIGIIYKFGTCMEKNLYHLLPDQEVV